MISAKIIADSNSWLNKRLITFVLEYPRFIHSELLTHRVFSKNSGSSRAIPFIKFAEKVKLKPAIPLWTGNNKGMQGPIITDPEDLEAANRVWLEARDIILDKADTLYKYGVHKQNVNRLLEPFLYIRIVLTTTETDNWFQLRDHDDAQPEIHELAKMMKYAMENSVPKFLEPGMWHIPFVESPFPVPEGMNMMDTVLKCSVARCARVSYENFDGTNDVAKDIGLFNRLLVSEPLHASPAEHQNRVPFPNELKHMGSSWHYMSECPEEQPEWKEVRGKYFSNISGYIQLRKLIECGEFK